MEENKNIAIDKDDLVDFIWMSYRYCIGRHSIAAAMHVNTIVKYIHHLHPNEIQQTIKDIRSELTYTFKHRHNVYVDGYATTVDAYTMFYKYCISQGEKTGNQLSSIINEHGKQLALDTDINVMSFRDNANTLESKVSDYEFDRDIMGWIKLLNYLDVRCHKFIMFENKATECFPYFTVNNNGNIEEVYTTVESYKEHPYIESYIDPQYLNFIDK